MTAFLTRAMMMSILTMHSIFAMAQCDPRDKTPVKVASITSSLVTCPQNGAITVNGITGGGGDYVYEIFSGPILRGIQSQNVFAALLAGKYRVRVTGCNGNFFESDTVTVGSYYLESPAHGVTYLTNESFKCNNTTNGRVLVSLTLSLPSGEYSDTQYYKLPLYYQVSLNGDPATGFQNSPMLPFRQALQTRGGRGNAARQYLISDTISGLAPATTYYVRVTDGCGVFKTSSVTIPNLAASPVYTYDFQVKEPYKISTVWSNVKGNCVQWGELTILSSGAPVNSITADNTFAPITAVLKRQDNGQVIDTKSYQSGALFKGTPSGSTNNLIFDSIPRVPVTLELTDKCGNVTVINAATPSTKVPFKLQTSSICVGANAGFRVDTYNAAPSLPMRLKVYDNNNALLIDRILGINYLFIYLANPSGTFDLSQVSFVPSFGEYRIVLEDQCGITDSLVYNFQPGGALSPTPTFRFSPYNPTCSYADGLLRYFVDVAQTNVSPVMSVKITSGPVGLTYPRSLASYRYFSNISTSGYSSLMGSYFDSLLAGTYQVQINYGCGQQTTTSFTISGGVGAPTSGYLNFDVGTVSPCSSVSTVVVRGSGNVVSPPISTIIDPPSVRILAAPIEFLRTISISKNGSDPGLPFDLGYFSAISIAENGIDTTALRVYPRYSYISVTSGLGYPPGNYTYQLYTKCTGVILDTKSFTVGSVVPYGKPNLGASSGYICSGGEIKVVGSPIGGRRPFIYQIKRADDPDDRNYSAYQSDSIFILPSSTPAGTVYIMRAVDACNNSFVGRVVVNSFTSRLYVSFSNDCIGDPTRVLTGYIPGATYRWTKPDGSVIVTNSNELYIPVFQLSDIGTYTVDVNALDGCISEGAASIIGSRCYVVLAVSFTEFAAAKKSNNLVNLRWKMDRENDVHHYEIERSQDGISWTTIETKPVTAVGTGSNSLNDQLVNNLSPVLFYRIKAVDATGKAVYSKTEKVYFNQSFSVTKVYPSPFTQSLSIDFMSETNDKCLVQLFDIEGREVSRSVMPVSKGINHYQYSPVLAIDAGQYTLSITQGANHYNTKVVKMN